MDYWAKTMQDDVYTQIAATDGWKAETWNGSSPKKGTW